MRAVLLVLLAAACGKLDRDAQETGEPARSPESLFAGGTELLFKGTMSVRRVATERISAYGVGTYAVVKRDAESFFVRLPEGLDPEPIKALLRKSVELDFRITVEPQSKDYEQVWNAFLADQRPDITVDGKAMRWVPLSEEARAQFPKERLPGDGDPWVLCEIDDNGVTGADLENVRCRRNTEGLGGSWLVSFEVRDTAQARLQALTSEVGRYMAIIVDGELTSAPLLQSSLRDAGQISQNLSEEEARALAATLSSGAYVDGPPELVSEHAIPKSADR